MTTITITLLSIHLAAAAWFDLRERRIPNAVIASGLTQGLAVALLSDGLPGAGAALLGAGAGMLALFPFFLMRLVGAGDAKLLGVVGAFTGAPALLPVTLYTFAAGGLLGLAALVSARSTSAAVANLRQLFFAAVLRARGAPIGLTELGLKTAARIPYALAIAAGVALWTLTEG